MIYQRLQSRLKQKRCTLLGVGPMSLHCVDATIELANHYEIPLILIASRRQIDSEEFGGGYVNNWTTAEYACYVINRDVKSKILLARDHGGPWQNMQEVTDQLSLKRAMESAKASFKADLDAGFQILHIDPSIDIHGHPNTDEVLNRIFELYEYSWAHAQRLGQEVIFEIGTEEQSGSTNTQEELEYTLHAMEVFCKKQRLPRPSFVVIQTGTRVMEMRNVGSFDSPIRVANELPAEIQVPKMIEICSRYDILMKEHNTDYLSDEALQWHPRLGIHSANVAPEFGVVETCALLKVLRENQLDPIANAFLEIAYQSNKWNKWMLPDTQASDEDKAIIAGHYVFSTTEGIEIKKQAMHALQQKKVDLSEYLKEAVKQSILRYLINFRLV